MEMPLQLFINMLVIDYLKVDYFTLSTACAITFDFVIEGKQVHVFAIKFGFGSNTCIKGVLLDMYIWCERMVDDKKMFNMWEELEKVDSFCLDFHDVRLCIMFGLSRERMRN